MIEAVMDPDPRVEFRQKLCQKSDETKIQLFILS